MSNSQPLVSIVTPSYNQAQFIEQTILSVLNQDYPNIEYLVIDGGSTDGTLEILARYSDRVKWLSQLDHGQADAINKGFRMSSGAIMGWLNSDDLLVPGAISEVVRHFQQNPTHFLIYGDALAIDEQDTVYGFRIHVRQTNLEELLHMGDFIVQPAAFWKAELWEQVGELDTSLRYTMDYEYWIRTAQSYEFHYLPVCLAKERLYAQAKSFSSGLPRIDEINSVVHRYGSSKLPRNFRAQAAALHLSEGLKRFVKGDTSGLSHIIRCMQQSPPVIPFVRYFLIFTFFGTGSLSRFWLRTIQKQSPRLKRDTRMPVRIWPTASTNHE